MADPNGAVRTPPDPEDTAFVRCDSVQKSYDGEELVVRDLNLDIARGEFLTMLGPSGSGKTTCLMMLAGFETATHGSILLDGTPIDNLPPHKRGIGMVFQNYALFPHMTVAENLAFPLEVRKLRRDLIKERVARVLDMVEMGGFDARRPAQLSGGQQQRIAVARALVFEPRLVLMDEPLGALDKQLREQMQYEIKRIHDNLGVTVVYVTHDQSEALTMSDRIAVFNEGIIQQLATPQDLYERPESAFVAQFIGENNRLYGTVLELEGDDCTIRLDSGAIVHALRVNTFATTGARESRPGAGVGAQRLRRRRRGTDLSRRSHPDPRFGLRKQRFHRKGAERAGARSSSEGQASTHRLAPRRHACTRSELNWGLPGTTAIRPALPEPDIRRYQMDKARRSAISIAAAGSMGLAAFAVAQQPVTLTIVSWGGAYSASQQNAYHDPYVAANPHVRIVTDDGSANALAGIRAQAQAGNVTWDLVDMLPSDAQVACDEGLLLEIDYDKVLAPAPDGTPASKDFLPGSLVGDCFIPQIVYSTIVSYNHSMFPADKQPKSIADFFDVEAFPGKRAIQNRPGGNLEWALYADGVPIEEIYDALRTPEGVERALRKLDTIKEHLVFWSEGAQAPQLLADREVAFATGYNGRMFAASEEEGQPIRIIWDGQLGDSLRRR